MCASSNLNSQNLQLAAGVLVASKMATVEVGHIEEFHPDVDHITTYLERMELYFTANDIADPKKAAALLTCIGGKTYRIVKSLLAPNLPISKSFPDLKETLKSHFAPKPSIITERFHFNRKRQQSCESIIDFTAELRRLAIN